MGTILLSELSRRLIRSIQKLIRVGRNEVVVVMRVDKEKGYIDLSKRRVSPEDIAKCEERFMKSKTVASILRHVALKPSSEELAADTAVKAEAGTVTSAEEEEEAAAQAGGSEEARLESLYDQIVWPLGKQYGHRTMPSSSRLPPSGATLAQLMATIARRLTTQPITLRADVELTCYTEAGIDVIKRVLHAGEVASTEVVPIKAKLVAPPLGHMDYLVDFVHAANRERENLGLQFLVWSVILGVMYGSSSSDSSSRGGGGRGEHFGGGQVAHCRRKLQVNRSRRSMTRVVFGFWRFRRQPSPDKYARFNNVMSFLVGEGFAIVKSFRQLGRDRRVDPNSSQDRHIVIMSVIDMSDLQLDKVPPPARPRGRPKRKHYPRKVKKASSPTPSPVLPPASYDAQAQQVEDGGESMNEASPSTARLLHLKSRGPAGQNPTIQSPTAHKLEAENLSPSPDTILKNSGRNLRKVMRDPADWELRGEIKTYELAAWFEHEKNDYNPKEYLKTNSVLLNWLESPGDRPKDYRAHVFKASLIAHRSPIFRATMHCTGACCRDLQAEAEEEDKSRHRSMDEENGSDPEDETTGDNGEEARGEEEGGDADSMDDFEGVQESTKKRKKRVEITADKPDTAKIWQKGEHDEAQLEALVWSHRLRRLAADHVQKFGGTPATVKKEFTKILTGDSEDGWKVPNYRQPSDENINNLFAAFRRRRRMAKNSFVALGMLAAKNPDKVFMYSRHDPKSALKLTFGMSDEFCKDSAILNSLERGVGFDSSWRSKNENFAPMTLLTTINKDGRMHPISALLSEDVQASTLSTFLEGTAKAIMRRAKEICSGQVVIKDRSPDDEAVIRKNAEHIVRQNSWTPFIFMIDKSAAERIAIRSVFKGARIRLCQFHIIQAILRWTSSVPTTEQTRKGQLRTINRKLNDNASTDILNAFRRMQRCRTRDELPRFQQIFEDSLRVAYMATDIGLPYAQPRTGPLNTNNWTEAAFKLFDTVFLENRKNKRLASIILNDFFPYFRFWVPRASRFSQDHIQVTRDGHDMWANGKLVKGQLKALKYTVDIARPHFQTTKDRNAEQAANAFCKSEGKVNGRLTDDSQSKSLDTVLSNLEAAGIDARDTWEPEPAQHPKHSRILDAMTQELAKLEASSSPMITPRMKKSSLHSFVSPSRILALGGRPKLLSPLHKGRTHAMPIYNHLGSPGHKVLQFDQSIRFRTSKSRVNPTMTPVLVKKHLERAQKKVTDHANSQGKWHPKNEHQQDLQDDLAVATYSTSSWMRDDYELRIEEIINMEDWVRYPNPGSLTTKSDMLDDLLVAVNKKEKLDTVLFFTLYGHHYLVFEHKLSSGFVVCHNSLGPMPSHSNNHHNTLQDPYAGIDITQQKFLAAFLHKCRPIIPPSLTDKHLANVAQQYGTQITGSSCGFWAIFFALQIILEVPMEDFVFSSLSEKQVKNTIQVLYNEYFCTGQGGLSGGTVMDFFSPLDSNLSSRLQPYMREAIWAPLARDVVNAHAFWTKPTEPPMLKPRQLSFRMCLQDDTDNEPASGISSDSFHTARSQPTSSSPLGEPIALQTIPTPTPLDPNGLLAPSKLTLYSAMKKIVQAMQSRKKSVVKFKPKWLNIVELSPKEFSRLHMVNQWISGDVLNAYISLVSMVAGDMYLLTSSYFMNTLHSKGYPGVARWFGKRINAGEGMFTGNIVKMLCPISQPLQGVKNAGGLTTGNHWSLCVVDFVAKHIEYWNSLRTPAFDESAEVHKTMLCYLTARHKLERKTALNAAEWSFVNLQTPQQGNSHDCGVFVMANVLSCVLDLPCFDQADMGMPKAQANHLQLLSSPLPASSPPTPTYGTPDTSYTPVTPPFVSQSLRPNFSLTPTNHSEADLDAADTLVHFWSTPVSDTKDIEEVEAEDQLRLQPSVHFNDKVSVRRFRKKSKSKAPVDTPVFFPDSARSGLSDGVLWVSVCAVVVVLHSVGPVSNPQTLKKDSVRRAHTCLPERVAGALGAILPVGTTDADAVDAKLDPTSTAPPVQAAEPWLAASDTHMSVDSASTTMQSLQNDFSSTGSSSADAARASRTARYLGALSSCLPPYLSKFSYPDGFPFSLLLETQCPPPNPPSQADPTRPFSTAPRAPHPHHLQQHVRPRGSRSISPSGPSPPLSVTRTRITRARLQQQQPHPVPAPPRPKQCAARGPRARDSGSVTPSAPAQAFTKSARAPTLPPKDEPLGTGTRLR
ncbi:hypothetical protein DFH11DRAFT_1810540 [Phellopilus nigrolimitatus]|nr:hypothetical protein DFH11DRAFT_1810540 [Phellopilus nigrolimitatus]